MSILDEINEAAPAAPQPAQPPLTDEHKTIRALLAERDDVLENGKQAVRWAPSSAHWSNELKRLFGEDAREGIDALEARLRAAQAERDALRDALRHALEALENGARVRNGEGGTKYQPPIEEAAIEAIRNHLGVKND